MAYKGDDALDDLYTGGIARAREATALRQAGAFAHFPGTGPADKKCRDCVYFGPRHRADGRVFTGKCGRYIAMTGLKIDDANYIAATSSSCKYFDEKGQEHGTDDERQVGIDDLRGDTEKRRLHGAKRKRKHNPSA